VWIHPGRRGYPELTPGGSPPEPPAGFHKNINEAGSGFVDVMGTLKLDEKRMLDRHMLGEHNMLPQGFPRGKPVGRPLPREASFPTPLQTSLLEELVSEFQARDG